LQDVSQPRSGWSAGCRCDGKAGEAAAH
jgi:hypothetical protein